MRLVPIKFRTAGKRYDFNALELDLEPGQDVIVETDRGRALGTVVATPREESHPAPDKVKNVIRLATEDDLKLAEINAGREREALDFCQRRVQERNMEMKLVRAEYLYDGSKIIFFFTADGRVDFRELVRDLAHHFHTRIEMRQIGVRDEAKLVGGMGICGRELCCCSFLTEFNPVSVKMAKEQGLALNPNKISGQCGRLLCCLGYEYETYCDLKKGLPRCGKRIEFDGQQVEVLDVNVITQKVTFGLQEGQRVTLTAEQFRSGKLQMTEQPRTRQRGPEPRGSEPAQARPTAADQGNRQEGRPSGERRRKPQRPVQPRVENPAQAAPPAPVQPKGEDDATRPKRRRRGRRRPKSKPE